MLRDNLVNIPSFEPLYLFVASLLMMSKWAFRINSQLTKVFFVLTIFLLSTIAPISFTSVWETTVKGPGTYCFSTVAYARNKAPKNNRLTAQEMNQVNRIINGVLGSSQFLTPEVHKQFWGIMNSRGVSNQFLKEYRHVTSDLYINYYKYFWQDAFHSLNNGHPYKSKYRSNYEKLCLKMRRITPITPKRIKYDNELIEKIAAKKPVTYGGKKIVINQEMIKQAMKQLDEIQRRFDLLYSRNLPQAMR